MVRDNSMCTTHDWPFCWSPPSHFIAMEYINIRDRLEIIRCVHFARWHKHKRKVGVVRIFDSLWSVTFSIGQYMNMIVNMWIVPSRISDIQWYQNIDANSRMWEEKWVEKSTPPYQSHTIAVEKSTPHINHILLLTYSLRMEDNSETD